MFDIYLHCLRLMTTVTIYWDIAMQWSQFFTVLNVRVSWSMLTPVSFVSVSEIYFCKCFSVQDLCIHCRWSETWYFIVEMGCDKNIWCSKITWCTLNGIFCDHVFFVMCYYKYLRCWVRTNQATIDVTYWSEIDQTKVTIGCVMIASANMPMNEGDIIITDITTQRGHITTW